MRVLSKHFHRYSNLVVNTKFICFNIVCNFFKVSFACILVCFYAVLYFCCALKNCVVYICNIAGTAFKQIMYSYTTKSQLYHKKNYLTIRLKHLKLQFSFGLSLIKTVPLHLIFAPCTLHFAPCLLCFAPCSLHLTLCTFVPMYLCIFMPLNLCTFAPLHLYTSPTYNQYPTYYQVTQVHIYHLHIYWNCTNFSIKSNLILKLSYLCRDSSVST